jgi:thioesterase domain-containing protein
LWHYSFISVWGLLYLLLNEYDLVGHIVIQESNTKFIKPVESNLSVTCSFESVEQKDKFIKMFKRKGVARIQLESRITFDNDDHVVFKGAYVVHT